MPVVFSHDPIMDSETAETFLLIINKENRITYVNDNWLRFAFESGRLPLTRDKVLNRPLLDFIEGRESRMLYEYMISKAREKNSPFAFPFRCDGPDIRRFMRMEIIPKPQDQVYFASEILKTELREPVKLLDDSAPRSDDIITICSMCKCVRVSDNRWVEVEEAIATLGLFDSRLLPMLSHGLCAACSKSIRESLKGLKQRPND